MHMKFTVVMNNPNLWVLNITILRYSQIREKKNRCTPKYSLLQYIVSYNLTSV